MDFRVLLQLSFRHSFSSICNRTSLGKARLLRSTWKPQLVLFLGGSAGLMGSISASSDDPYC